PSLDSTTIPPDDRANVIVQSRQQRVTTHCVAVRILEYPGRRLIVPHECVANDQHAVLLSELHILVRRSEVVDAWARMDQRPLEHVFRRDGVEVGLHERGTERVTLLELSGIHRSAHPECV